MEEGEGEEGEGEEAGFPMFVRGAVGGGVEVEGEGGAVEPSPFWDCSLKSFIACSFFWYSSIFYFLFSSSFYLFYFVGIIFDGLVCGL